MRETILAVLGASLVLGGPLYAAEKPLPEGLTPELRDHIDAHLTGEQIRFFDAVDAARKAYAAGANEMAKGAARPARAKALCLALKSPKIQNWFGRVTTLSSNSDGKGVLTVKIAKDLHIRTSNNEFSDAITGDKTLIDPNGSMFKKAVALTEGQWVRFSAVLFRDRTDCFREISMTMAGSLEEPEFLARFTDIAPIESVKEVARAR